MQNVPEKTFNIDRFLKEVKEVKKVNFVSNIPDFIVSCILINSIKRNENNSHITVVCSKKNYNYIKGVSLVDEAILYPENILERIKFYFYLKKKNFDVSLALDGKKKSIYSSLFSSPKKKFLNTTKLVYKFIFFPLFTKIFYIKDYKSRLEILINFKGSNLIIYKKI